MNVCILGHSLVFWAKHLGVAIQLGLSGLPLIQWLVMWGMIWDKLMPALSETLRSRCQLEALILHGGKLSSDLFSSKAFIIIVRNLSLIHHLLPKARLVWVSMVPRRVWRGSRALKSINMGRKKVNKQVGKIF